MIARSLIIVASLAVGAGNMAHAIGFGSAPSLVPMGSQLDFRVPILLTPEEVLPPQCVRAEVYQGDQRLLAQTVRTAVERNALDNERVVRVISTVTIDEPFVTVTVTVGCINTIERRFTVFADPPLVAVAAAQAVSGSAVATNLPAASTTARAAAPSTGAPAVEANTATPSTTTPVAAGATGATALRRATRSPAATTQRAERRASVAAATDPSSPRGGASTRVAAAPTPPRNAAPVSRLRLDAVEPVARTSAAASAVQDAALRVAAMAASAALAEQAASSALAAAATAAERMKAVEQALEKLRADAERDRQQTAQLRANLAQAEAAKLAAPWLGAGLALLLALALWLWLRLRRTQKLLQAQWWAAANAANQNQHPKNVDPPTLHPMTLPPQLVQTPPARPMSTVSTPSPPRTTGFSSGFGDSMMAQAPRDVSIEELIDLEQQAEFFVVLGQDDAAIDLLMGHIRGSGGTSPLPYLKLLEIYRRLGDRESYERTQTRFNHRFNAYAPDWDADMQQGRPLDEYPEVMRRLEHAWRTPLDSMAELESLMFRRDGGELFELPAYREVLVLYSIARDLLDHQGGPNTAIDVLLPLGDDGFEPTTARPHLLTVAPTGQAELGLIRELVSSPAVRTVIAPFSPEDQSRSEFGLVDLDLNTPLANIDDSADQGERSSEHNSQFAALPPTPRKP